MVSNSRVIWNYRNVITSCVKYFTMDNTDKQNDIYKYDKHKEQLQRTPARCCNLPWRFGYRR